MGMSSLRDSSGFHPGLWVLHPFGILPDFIRGYGYVIPSGFFRISSGVMGISFLRVCDRISSGVMGIASLRDSSGFHPGLWVLHPFGIPPDFIRGYEGGIPSGFLRISSGFMSIASLRDCEGGVK